jgi:chorismate mutase
MSGVNIPIEIYDLLERRLGRDDAMAVAKSIEASLTHIEEPSREMAVQRKIEAKEELRVELRDELSTKEDLAKLEGSMNARFERMDKKFTVLFMVTIFTVIFLNQNALEFLARILGLVK